MRWESDWVEEDGGDFRLHCGGASPLTVSDTVLCHQSTWPPIVSRRLPMGRWDVLTTILNGGGAKRLPVLGNARWWHHSLCGGQIVLSIESTLVTPIIIVHTAQKCRTVQNGASYRPNRRYQPSGLNSVLIVESTLAIGRPPPSVHYNNL